MYAKETVEGRVTSENVGTSLTYGNVRKCLEIFGTPFIEIFCLEMPGNEVGHYFSNDQSLSIFLFS